MSNSRIITDDIFAKAARRYCQRRNIDSQEIFDFRPREEIMRDELEKLCDKILALYEVGALPRAKLKASIKE